MRKYFLFVLFIGGFSALQAQDIFSSSTEVKDIYLNFMQPNWLALLEAQKLAGEDERILASIKIDGVTYDSVGVRYKGNSSFFNVNKSGSKKLPFNIKLDYIRKKQELPNGQESIKLSNVFRDPSFLREVLSYEIVGNYMPSPRAGYVRLYVNGEPYGLYNITEPVDKVFIKKHFGYKKGTLIKCDPKWKVTPIEGCPVGDKASLQYLGDDPECYQKLYEFKSKKKGPKRLIKLAKALKENPEEIEKMLNVDQVLWMHAFNNVLVNLDSYTGRLCHNYYLWRDSFGIWQPFVWDMNLSFGAFRFNGIDSRPMSDTDMQKMSMFIHYKTKNEKRPLITNLLGISIYRKTYVAHVKTILEDYFLNGKYKESALKLQAAIDQIVMSDTNKLYSYETYKENFRSTTMAGKSKIIGITELMDARTEYLRQHPLMKKTDPKIEKVEDVLENNMVKIRAIIKDSEQAWLYYRSKSGAPFKRTLMNKNSETSNVVSASSDFELILEPTEIIQYYILAEGDKTVSLSPKRASFEFYSVKNTFESLAK